MLCMPVVPYVYSERLFVFLVNLLFCTSYGLPKIVRQQERKSLLRCVYVFMLTLIFTNKTGHYILAMPYLFQ
jgi:hypothetical protein